MDFWNSKIIKKSRKLHKCQMCRGLISIGDNCHNEVGVFNGDFNNYYLCNRCYDLITHDSDTWVYENEIVDIIVILMECDFLECPNCHKHSLRDYNFTDNKHLKMSCICDECEHEYIVNLSSDTLLKERDNNDN